MERIIKICNGVDLSCGQCFAEVLFCHKKQFFEFLPFPPVAVRLDILRGGGCGRRRRWLISRFFLDRWNMRRYSTCGGLLCGRSAVQLCRVKVEKPPFFPVIERPDNILFRVIQNIGDLGNTKAAVGII